MSRSILALGVWLCVGVAGGLLSPAMAGDGRIMARVSLEDAAGQVVYGDWVRVFLVTAPVAVPEVDLAGADAAVERTARLNSAHMTFFIRFRV
jgi:hypothetical protein